VVVPGPQASPSPTDTSPDGTPTPDATPTPAPAPALSCGTVMIRDLKIWTDDPNGPVIEYRPWSLVDLMNPDASTINDLPVEPGTYTRVRFTIHKPVGAGSPGPGTGNPSVNDSIHLCGVQDGIPFEYRDDVTDRVDRRDPGGVTIDSNGPARLLLIFDSSTWFDGIDLSTATLDANGVVQLDRDHNADLARALRQNFEQSVRLANAQHR
jgi:hypothetical protein